MARSYKRDKNGRFASGGGGGGTTANGTSGKRLSGNVAYTTAPGTPSRTSRARTSTKDGGVRYNKTTSGFGSANLSVSTKRKGNTVRNVTSAEAFGNAGGRINGAKDVVRTKRTGNKVRRTRR